MDYQTVVIYHANCADGLCAAWCFTQAHKFGKYFGQIKFYPTNERIFNKDLKMPDLSDKYIYIVDFSYPKETLEHILKIARKLIVLDHHQTYMDYFLTNDNEYKIPTYCIFDVKSCASEITWDYLYGKNYRPWFIQHIRDRDLWLWENKNSKAFSNVLYSMGYHLSNFDILLYSNPYYVYKCGRNIENRNRKCVKYIVKGAKLMLFENYIVYAVNTVQHRSDCGAELAGKIKCDFAFVYNQIQFNTWCVSLRGIASKNIDLSAVAKKHGGGGHPLACSFTYYGDINNILRPC